MKVGPIDCSDTLVNTTNQICVTSLKVEGPHYTAAEALILSLNLIQFVFTIEPDLYTTQKPVKNKVS